MGFSLLTLACLVGAALAGPLQREAESRCATECPSNANEKFDYKPGHKYAYDFKATNVINVSGNNVEQKAEMTGIAEIYVKDRCEMSLQLRNIEIRSEMDNDEAASLVDQLVALPLSFSWLDGKIEHVCADPEETTIAENIKKGILSAIVNTMEEWRSPSRHREIDGFGSCETKYSVIKEQGNTIVIRKEKSLKTCDNRHSGSSAVIAHSYSSPESERQTLPLLSEEKLVCEQEIRDNVIQRSTCKERSIMKPLDKYESMVEMHSELQLSLASVQQSSQSPHQTLQKSQKKPILYNYEQEQDTETRERETVQILAEICPQAERLLRPSVSKLYHKLILAIKSLPPQSVQSIYESLKRKELCQSQKTLDIFLDALPMAGTEGSIKLMVDLLQTKQVTGLKAKLWPASLALIPNPNAEAISAVLPLVSGEEKSRPVLLGLSAMIYRVCSRSDCDNIPSVREATRILHEALGSRCSSEKQSQIESVLKAFGNMGYLGEAEETVIECARSSEKPIAIRLAAIDAFRRNTKKMPSALAELFASKDEDFEVRIAALSTIINDADEQLVNTIRQVLDNEQDEQVLAYTRSLVKNWQETSSPLKQEVKEMLQSVQIPETSKLGYWENSKNIELSAFNVPTNLGASLESNIIHSSRSKVPRSVSSRIDVDLFGKNINLFEFGARAEGLEKAIMKILGAQQTSSKKSSWFSLASSQTDAEDKSEASFYLRTMGTEFLDVSVSDLTSVGKMMQFADVVNKLSQGEKADFAHSFLFLNTRLVIQSVTGRSYSFGATGSATVGLTADGKFDVVNLMSSPRNCDIAGRLQPSANVQLSAIVGIHSEKSRPSIKIVTSLHTEADVGAKFHVKDSHLAVARWDIPSEDVSLLKISTELFEVDANNNEKPIIEDMQRKVDHCITSLEKPLGIQLCGKFEIPKPFVSRTFPYARGIGNLELSIKKTDTSMKGYVASLEIPKHKSDSMSYRLTLDTPESSVQRKFQANLELKKQPTGEREFNLDIHSPFKAVSTTGSYSWKRDLIQSTISVVTDRSRRYSLKTVMEMSSSGSEKRIKPTVQLSMPSQEPLTMTGSIVLTQGRKQQITVDLRSDKQGSKPFVLTGTLKKEGRLELSTKSQWKMSADIVAKTPILTSKLHSAVHKQAGQSQSISSSLSLDYETARTRKQSIKLSSEIRQNQRKISASAHLESTQAPKMNFIANWDMQGIPKEAMKNDITLKYGRQPERNFIQISQTSHIGDQQSLSRGKISVKAPQFNVDSELSIAADLHGREASNFHVEADLRYKAEKHIKSLVHVKHMSKKPVKMAVKAVLEYPGRKMMYEDEIEEKSRGVYEGRSNLQWQDNQQASLQYRYKKLSDSSVMHHELESTLVAPFTRTPLTQKGHLKITKERIEITNEVILDRRSSYSLEAKLNKRGSSLVAVKCPMAEGTIELSNDPQKKSASLDVQVKSRRPRHITAITELDWSNKKSLMAELSLDADRNPSQKLAISAEVDLNQRRSYGLSSKVQFLDIFAADISCKGQKGLKGIHELSVEATGQKFRPISIVAQQEITEERIRSKVTLKRSHRETAVAELQGKLERKSGNADIQVSASLRSPDRSFSDKQVSLKYVLSRSYSSVNLLSSVQVELSPEKKHEAQIEYSSQAKQSRELKVSVKTPYKKFIQQELTLSHQPTSEGQAFKAALEFNRQEIALSAEVKKQQNGRSVSLALRSPFSPAKEVELYAAYDNQRSQKSIETRLDVNGQRKQDFSVNYVSRQSRRELHSVLKTSITPELAIHVKSEINKPSFSHEVLVTKDSSRLFSTRISRQASGKDYTCQLEVKTSRNVITDIRLTKEVKGMMDKYVLKAKGPFDPISVAVQSSKSDENSNTMIVNVCKESSQRQCYNVKGYYKKENDSQKYKRFRKITLDIEKESESRSVEHICNIHYLLAQQENTIKSKLFVDSQGKRIGYDLSLRGRHHEEEPCEMDISLLLPTRTMRASVSAVHTKKRVLCDIEYIPDANSPAQKLSVQLKKEWDSQQKEAVGHFKLSHPALKQPLHVKYSLQKGESKIPAAIQIEMDYCSLPSEKIVIEMKYKTERSRPLTKSLEGRISSPAHNLDLNMKVSKIEGGNKDAYDCQWSWQSSRGQKSAQMIVNVLEKTRQGVPQKVEIKYTGPSSSLSGRIVGRSRQDEKLPSHVELQLMSNDRILGEIVYDKEGPCLELDVKNPEPLWKSQICMKKHEQKKLKLLSIECYHKERKCIDFSLDMDPSRRQIVNVAAQWKKEELREAAKSLKKIVSSQRALLLRESPQEVAQQIQSLCSQIQEKALEPLVTLALDGLQQLVKQESQTFDHIREIVQKVIRKLPVWPTYDEMVERLERYIVEKFPIYYEKAREYFNERAPEWLQIWLRKVVEQVERYIKNYCSRGTFCYQVKSTYQRRGLKKTQQLLKETLSQKMEEVQVKSSRKLRDVSNWFTRMMEKVSEYMEKLSDNVSFLKDSHLMRKLRKYSEQMNTKFEELRKRYFERAMEIIDDVMDHARQNQDFKVLSSLFIEAKQEVIKAWKDLDAEKALQPLREALLQKLPRNWIRQQFDVQDFNMPEGRVQLKFRHPFNSTHWQILKNALTIVKNKYQPWQ